MTTAAKPDWIAVDWGTTHLRVWAMAGDKVLAEAGSADGMGKLAREGFEPALLALISGWLSDAAPPLPIIACGMVGARQGWSEAPYRAIPCPPVGGALHRAPTRDPRLDVQIIPGLSQAAPPDVMRGEETQIAGFLAHNPGWHGTLVLPGTHAKWVQLAGGRVARFTTYLTGEAFALFATQSILRHDCGEADFDDAAFDAALAEGLADPLAIPAQLFAIRAAGLLTGQSPGQARARLSALLIAQEIAAARPLRGDGPVVVIGAGGLSRLYARALVLDGATTRMEDGAGLVLAGLAAARALQLE